MCIYNINFLCTHIYTCTISFHTIIVDNTVMIHLFDFCYRDWFRINPLEIVLLGCQTLTTRTSAQRDVSQVVCVVCIIIMVLSSCVDLAVRSTCTMYM